MRERWRAARVLALGALALAVVAAPAPAPADKGHFSPRPVGLSEPAQRALLLHDRDDELLVLGVELQAERRGEVLELIPFPSKPEISRVDGDPFAAAGRLVAARRLAFEGPVTKGGTLFTPAAVEVALQARIGLHDVTVVRVHDGKGVEAWVRAYFRARGADGLDLSAVAALAEDYVRRGYPWFVFDRVPVEPGRRPAEPLAYRFRSERIYYPLRTSNLVGGAGAVQLVLLVPGTFAVEEAPDAASRFWSTLRRAAGPVGWRVSTSAKITTADAEKVVPGAAQVFAGTPKLYLQVLEYTGPYRFADDLALEPADLRPFARKPIPWRPPGEERSFDLPGFTEDEVADYCEANPRAPACVARAGGR